MVTLFSIDSCISKTNLVVLNRELTIDDIDFEIVMPREIDSCSREASTYLCASIKQHFVREIKDAFPIDEDQHKYKKVTSLNNVIDVFYNKPSPFYKDFSVVKLKGNEKSTTYKKCYEQAIKESKEITVSQIDDAKAELLKSINNNLHDAVEQQKALFMKALSNIVIEQNITEEWFESHLSDSDKVTVAKKKNEIQEIDQEIEALKLKRITAQTDLYKLKRNFVESELDKRFNEAGKQAMQSIKDKVKSFAQLFFC